ncbi:hypothetical protein [Bradyrhizobium sp. AUGA SZCCT0182]|uniref:hypothetical protein n=1 Tax=Bradyrhizobium sp. AUGA SZCCT0182 TaxID=2807667 RepID=UPI001BA5CC25|nr:hypothetical protein [Bradyrhizobium sp. AUGA SZCCT0182]MBR1234006.1 hypothetical protein [Bradyrhizobium sp. AUGA SZCCT0182]
MNRSKLGIEPSLEQFERTIENDPDGSLALLKKPVIGATSRNPVTIRNIPNLSCNAHA